MRKLFVTAYSAILYGLQAALRNVNHMFYIGNVQNVTTIIPAESVLFLIIHRALSSIKYDVKGWQCSHSLRLNGISNEDFRLFMVC